MERIVDDGSLGSGRTLLVRPTRSSAGSPVYSVALRQLWTSYSPTGSLTISIPLRLCTNRTVSPAVYQMPKSGTWCVENLPVLLTSHLPWSLSMDGTTSASFPIGRSRRLAVGRLGAVLLLA